MARNMGMIGILCIVIKIIGLSMDDVNENVLIDDLINQLLDDKVVSKFRNGFF